MDMLSSPLQIFFYEVFMKLAALMLGTLLYSSLTLAASKVFPDTVLVCETQKGASIAIDTYKVAPNKYELMAAPITSAKEMDYWAGGAISEAAHAYIFSLPALLDYGSTIEPAVIKAKASNRTIQFVFYTSHSGSFNIDISDEFRKVTLIDCRKLSN